MKTIRINIEKWLDRLDERWHSLPVCKQQKFTLYFFAGYLLLTAGVILKVCCDMAKSDNKMVIGHIDNPVLKSESPASRKDTLPTLFKRKIYERK